MLKLSARLQIAFYRALDKDQGQALTEYALILALIAIVAIAALHLLSNGIKTELSSVASSL